MTTNANTELVGVVVGLAPWLLFAALTAWYAIVSIVPPRREAAQMERRAGSSTRRRVVAGS